MGPAPTKLSHPGCSRNTLTHLACDMSLPTAAAATGMLAFHASAVAFPQGAVMFLGPSGRGKSFLSVALALRGYEFIGDDHVTVSQRCGRYRAHLAYPGARLHPDSINKLWGPNPPRTEPIAQYTDKRRVPIGPLAIGTVAGTPLVGAVGIGEETADGEISIERMRPANALSELSEQLMNPYAATAAGRLARFDDLINLVDTVPVWHLRYPRTTDSPAAVAQLLASVLS